ncbi:MAG: hypothetical protein NVSMB3_11680 [Acidobacteriaceae bacterium]
MLGALLASLALPAQTHKVSRPEQVVRAIGVYEWTGDLRKPTASRLVPVTVFINGALEDAGVYLARPIPFALTPGNQYEFQQAGLARGFFDLAYARHLQTSDSAYEDGWFGYGSYRPPAAARKEPVLRASRNPAVLTSSREDAHPHLGTKEDTGTATVSDTPAPGKDPQPASPDPANPTKGSGSTSAGDPDRPTMRRRGSSSPVPADTSSAGSGSGSGSGSAPADDPDRPTLRRRSSDDKKSGSAPENDVAAVTSTGSLNNDPDRPNLHRGARTATANDTDVARLVGVPKELKQMVAVSDAANRPSHDFSRPWQDEQEHAAVLTRMQALARAELQTYSQASLTPSPTSAGQPLPPPAKAAAVAPRHPANAPVRRSRPAPPTPAPASLTLLDEDLRGYTLSYGGAPTYVYTAHTAGSGPDLQYVTVVAQADLNGNLQPTIKSTTDEAHLDRSPRMHFVDVVDVEASNRASLLFELRSRDTRQFALYRVLGARATPVFTTGTTQ